MNANSVSAIVPVHNGARHLAEGLRSILAQSHPVAEIIVVDDGSDDGSAAVARGVAPAVRVISQSRQGPAAARNAGAEAAGGAFLALLDHDDLWPAGRTANLLAAVAARPDAGLISGRIEIRAAPDAPADARLLQASHSHVPFLFPSGLIRRQIWLELGGMTPARDYSEDVDLYLRLLEARIPVVLADAVTLIYRQHGGNRSRAIERSQAALLDSLRASLRRRRAVAAGRPG